jgi:hypothetical protein
MNQTRLSVWELEGTAVKSAARTDAQQEQTITAARVGQMQAVGSVGFRRERGIEINLFILRPFFPMGAIEFVYSSGENLDL